MENFFHRHFCKSHQPEPELRMSLAASKVRRKSGVGGPSLGLLTQRKASVQAFPNKRKGESRRKSSTAPVRVNPRFSVKIIKKYTLKTAKVQDLEDLLWEIWMDCKLLNANQQSMEQNDDGDYYTSESESSESEMGTSHESRCVDFSKWVVCLLTVSNHCPFVYFGIVVNRR